MSGTDSKYYATYLDDTAYKRQYRDLNLGLDGLQAHTLHYYAELNLPVFQADWDWEVEKTDAEADGLQCPITVTLPN